MALVESLKIIANLPPGTTKDQLRELCARYTTIKINATYRSGRIDFTAPSKDLGYQIIDNLNGAEYNGATITFKCYWPFDER